MASGLKYFLIPDSQVLFVAKERTEEVNPSFVRLLQECHGHCTIDVVIPDAVRSEIIYQKVNRVRITAERARLGLETLGALTGKKILQLPADVTLAKKVEVKFDRWMKSIGAVIAPHAVNRQAWSDIIHSAVWRLPPFEYSEDAKHEKGFRDALIRASVLRFAKLNNSVTCAFVTDDNLLTKALQNDKVSNLIIFESMKQFLGHVSLVRDKIDQEQAIALQANAEKKFYDAKDPSCIYTRETIGAHIRTKFGTLLDSPGTVQTEARTVLANVFSTSVVWAQIGRDVIHLKGTTFSKCPKPSLFQWKSRLLFVGLFHTPKNQFMSPQLRKTLFEITWTSHIKASAITDARLVDTEFLSMTDNQFTVANEEEIKSFGFEAPPAPLDWMSLLGNFEQSTKAIANNAAQDVEKK